MTGGFNTLVIQAAILYPLGVREGVCRVIADAPLIEVKVSWMRHSEGLNAAYSFSIILRITYPFVVITHILQFISVIVHALFRTGQKPFAAVSHLQFAVE